MVYKFFDKKSSGRAIANEPNYQLVSELDNRIFENLRK